MGINDADRALTGQGREEIKKIGHWTVDMGYTFDLIATSPLKRAMETAEIIGQPQNRSITSRYGTSFPPGVIRCPVTADCDGGGDRSVLIVGHEPMLSIVISRIISGNATAS